MRTLPDERVAPDIVDPGPERKCILSGAHGARAALVRLALSPPGTDRARTVAPDVLARAPGRGAWIGVTRAELETAAARGKLKGALARAFARSLDGGALVVPADLGERIDAALTRALTDRLGLAAKAGQVLLGAERIAEKARAGRVAWLAHAADAGDDGRRKLDQAWRVGRVGRADGGAATDGGSRGGGVILPLDRATLSVALGRDNVVHLALTDRGTAERVDAALGRLLAFRGEEPGGPDEALEDDRAARPGDEPAPLPATTI